MADTNTNRLPRTRALAEAAGAKLYYTGEPCPQGHVAPRRTSNGRCTVCEQIATQTEMARRKDETARRKGGGSKRSVAEEDRLWELRQILIEAETNPGLAATRCADLAAKDARAKLTHQLDEHEADWLALAAEYDRLQHAETRSFREDPAVLARLAGWKAYTVEKYTRLAREAVEAEALHDMLSL